MAFSGRHSADEIVLSALVCGATAEAAAQKAGVSRRTVTRRLADPAFRLRLNELRAEVVQRSAAMLTAASTEAVRTLLDLQKPSTAPAIRLGAARAILEIGVKLREMAELEPQVLELQKRLMPADMRRD